MSNQLLDLLQQPKRPRILVVGDVMLDRYLFGDVDRISPEAPIPLLKVARREERLGGAGSVVAMLAALDVDVSLGAVVADDSDGARILELMAQQGVSTEQVVRSPDRRTTVKERLLGRTQSRHSQQIIRVDHETTRPLDDALAGELLESITAGLGDLDVVLVSDYDKGVCAGPWIAELAAAAGRVDVPVVADPARGVDYQRYAGCVCVTPNRTEAGLVLGRKIRTADEALQAARSLLRFGLKTAVVTLDRDGIAWADADGRSRLFPIEPSEVYDITGAGDMVLAALGFALALKADWPIAIQLANLAGGLEVQRLGVTPVTRDELAAELIRRGEGACHEDEQKPAAEEKILSIDALRQRLTQRRRAGQSIVMTNGCFDLLHPGHVASLQHARGQGQCLVVGLNSDQSVERLKGSGQPLIDQQGRAQMLAALTCVDYVVIFDDDSVAGLVQRVEPDVLVKSAQYTTEQVVGREVVQRRGGRIVLAPMTGTYSTSRLIQRIRDLES